MKTITLVTLMIFASSTFAACPDLAGTFSCTGDENLVIKQETVNNVTHYTFTVGTDVQTFHSDNLTRKQRIWNDKSTCTADNKLATTRTMFAGISSMKYMLDENRDFKYSVVYYGFIPTWETCARIK